MCTEDLLVDQRVDRTNQSYRLLAIEPFFGGSHRKFQEDWMRHSRHDWTVLSLPDRNWKWRMRHAGIWMAKETMKLIRQGASFDLIKTTDMMNVAEYRAFVLCDPEARTSNIASAPILTYFHENQVEYPSRFERRSPEYKRDLHFSFTNFVSALASDTCWFNSRFNHDSFLQGLKNQASHWPDFAPCEEIQSVKRKSEIMYPGIESCHDLEDSFKRRLSSVKTNSPMHLVWAARWEHDKGPTLLLDVLRNLQALGCEFQLSVIGQRYSKVPDEFDTIQNEFRRQLRHWGFVPRELYFQCLAEADVFLSTANHEFFGLAASEAILAGASPVLPGRLVYPELLNYLNIDPTHSLYHGDDEAKAAAETIRKAYSNRVAYLNDWRCKIEALRSKAEWAAVAERMDDAVVDLIANNG